MIAPSRNRVRTVALLSLSLAASTRCGIPWDLVKDGEVVKIYTRAVPGEAIKELKAVMKMKTTVDKLVAAYLDGDNHSKWFPKCTSSRIVRTPGVAKLRIYRHIENPWPVKDRDYVVEVDLVRDAKTGGATILARDVSGVVPENPDAVRMKKLVETWTLSPTEDGQVLATYVLDFDPGGSTPSSFINMALSKIGTDVFDGMYRYVEIPR